MAILGQPPDNHDVRDLSWGTVGCLAGFTELIHVGLDMLSYL